MNIDPIQYKGYNTTRRGDAAQARTEEAIADMATWAGQLLDSKRAVNDAQQDTPKQQISNTPIITRPSPFTAQSTPSVRATPNELPGVANSSKPAVLTWVPGTGLKWIEVPSSGNFVFTYQSEAPDGFVFEEMLPCVDEEEEP